MTQRKPHALGENIPVFCYHEVTPKGFERDLEYLRENGYTTIDADTLLDHIEKREKAPANSVVLTFDDGAFNLFEVAYPLLREFQMKGVAFLATAFHRDQTDEAYLKAGKEKRVPLNWHQIKSMHEDGTIDFQSHTHSHRYIPLWPKTLDVEGSDAEIIASLRGEAMGIEEDLRLAKKILEEKLGKTVKHLAFPNFNGTGEAITIGKEIGYQGFWWGVLPGRNSNNTGQAPTHIVRFKPEYIPRLPGKNRQPLLQILARRFNHSMSKMKHRKHAEQ